MLVGPGGAGDDANPAKNWDRNVLLTAGDAQVVVSGQNFNAVDFGILHWYVNNDPTEFNNVCTIGQAACETNLLNATSNTSAAAMSLPDTYQGLRNRIDQYTNRDPNAFEIHMTEFGYFDPIGDGNVVTGLFAADAWATALEEGASTVHWHEMSKTTFLGDASTLDRGPTFRAVQMLDNFFDSGDSMISKTSNSSNLKVHAIRQPDGSVAIMMINLLDGSSNDADVTLDIDGQPLMSTGTRWLWGSGQSGAPLQTSVSGLGNNFTITVPDRTIVVLLILAAPSIPGDFNGNGTVDAADYVTWRKGIGVATTQENYNLWRAHFGQTAGSGSVAGANAAVPEPTTLLTLIVAAAGVSTRRRWSAWPVSKLNNV